MNTKASFANSTPLLPNHIFAIILIIATELMFFGGLISAYLIARGNALTWPPIGQPRLPVLSTFYNSLLLLGSGLTLYLSNRTVAKRALAWLTVSFALGTMFVVFQGVEWARLIQFGLTTKSSAYGAFFYLIIGSHALHALVGLMMLFLYLCAHLFNRTQKKSSEFLQVAGLFWYFVVGIWPILYILVYIL